MTLYLKKKKNNVLILIHSLLFQRSKAKADAGAKKKTLKERGPEPHVA